MSEHRERESLLLPILIPVGALVAIVVVLFLFSRILLSLEANAATATALVAALGILGLAGFVASRRHVSGGTLGAFVGGAAGIAMLAGGIAIAVIGPPEPEVEPFHATLAAPEGAAVEGFASEQLEVEPKTPIELEFQNEDPSVGHNVQVFGGPDDSAEVLFDGTVITGPDTIAYEIEPLAEGEFFFNCRVHPTTMTGTITAAAGAGDGGDGGEGGGGVEVVAQNIEFTTDTITLPAETPTELTLDNRDPAPHNVSIFEDDSAAGEPLFTFEPFAGPAAQSFPVEPLPAGEYFFRCDVHPNMQGTVVVEGGGGGQGAGGDGGADGGGGEDGDGDGGDGAADEGG